MVAGTASVKYRDPVSQKPRDAFEAVLRIYTGRITARQWAQALNAGGKAAAKSRSVCGGYFVAMRVISGVWSER
ncbi:hypothetical protein KCP69_12515 [Salmonella enterica subsp. enterica]|nr:hypothetical protein KCP69_12515 [Salmonella enterica subsp. enterica]